MAGSVKYHQQGPSCDAIQYNGTNAADIVTFAPGYAFLEEGKLVLRFPPSGYVEVVIGWYISKHENPKDVFTFSFSDANAFEDIWDVTSTGYSVAQNALAFGRYAPKPIAAVEAVMWNGENFAAVQAVCPQAVQSGNALTIPGGIMVYVEEFVLRDQVRGTFSKIKGDLFNVFYQVQTI